MQAPPPSRPYPRRSPGAEPGPPPTVPARSISPAIGSIQPRSSLASTRSAPSTASKRPSNNPPNNSMPLSQIEKSVTHLLVATKQLLETLTQWSRGQATDGQVSDVYVKLGYEFNMACRAFAAINVDTSDLGNVPDSLRHILEATLSQEASVESLEKYLPRIRDIIINLLHGLKKKQQKLRQRQSPRERDAPPDRTISVGSSQSGLTNMLDEGIENGYRTDLQRGDSLPANFNSSPPRRFAAQRDPSRAASVASEQSTISSTTMQNMPVMSPYAETDAAAAAAPPPAASDLLADDFPPPPPPPPETKNSALAALQKGGDLERRASRRYSQYQISKHLGGTSNGVPILPPQNTPVPNRGRGDVKESIRAVQVRESLRSSSSRHVPGASSRSGGLDSSSSPARVPRRVSEEPSPPPAAADESPILGGADDDDGDGKLPRTSATLKGPLLDPFPAEEPGTPKQKPPEPSRETAAAAADLVARSVVEAKSQDDPFAHHHHHQAATSPAPAPKELTLFLQYKSKVKKLVLSDGFSELSIGRLQLAFIDKFSWNTHNNGADLPEIYIQDPISGVRHELEDLSDIKDRTVLVLNIEPLDEVKRHIDDGIASLAKMVKEVKQNVDDHGQALQRVSDRQQEAAKEIARISAPPPAAAAPVTESRPGSVSGSRKMNVGAVGTGGLSELRTLRRDLAVMRQTYSDFQAEIQSSMSALRTKANNVKVAAVKASATGSADGGGSSSGASYVADGRKKLNSDSDSLVTKVDDLQDTVEDLRKDVVHRGVRPLPRQLEVVTKDITVLTKELKKMEEYIQREKPIWTKIWEKELENVCQGRDELRLMEDLVVDLQDDLEKASETFTLVEAATKEQMKDNGSGASAGNIRNFSKGLVNLGNSIDPSAAKEGVLGEVRALQPNHENRLEAIERAEKARQRELESRQGGALQKELSRFVEAGKLKKSGGFEEVDRARRAKDDRIRREVWERQNGIIPEEPVSEDGLEVTSPRTAEDEVREEPMEPEDGEQDASNQEEENLLQHVQE